MNNIISLAIPLFVLILLGFIAGKLKSDDTRGLVWLNVFIVYLALPALIFSLVSEAPVEQLANFSFVIATTLATYLVFMVMFIVATMIGRVRPGGAAMQGAAAAYGNVGYMGVPLAVAFFGEAAALPASLIVCFDSILLFTLVPLFQGMDGQGEGLKGFVGALRAIVFNPLIIALVLGILVASTEATLPRAVTETVGYLAAAAAPAALFGIGVIVARQPLGHVSWEIPVITLCKLVLHPMLALAILLLIGGFDPMWINVAVLLAALPTAANVYVMAIQHDSYVDGTSNAIFVTMLLSLATVTGILVLISQEMLPASLQSLL